MKKGIIHKALVIAVAATLALSTFAGCTNSNKAASSSTPAVATEQKVLTVSVTLSKEFIDGVNSLSNHLGNSSSPSSNSSSKLPDGIIKITKNKDGSETMVMTKAKYNEMMKGMKDSLSKTIKQLTSPSSSAPVQSFKSITANDKMDDFKVVVDKESYTNSLDGLSLLGLYIGSGLYQEFNNVSSPKVTFHIIDSKDNKEFKTLRYPDDMQNAVSSEATNKKADSNFQTQNSSERQTTSKFNQQSQSLSSYTDSEYDKTNAKLAEHQYFNDIGSNWNPPQDSSESANNYSNSSSRSADDIDVDGASTPSDSIFNSKLASDNS